MKREYRYVPRNKKIKRRRVISLVLAASLLAGGYIAYREMNRNTGAVAATNVEYPTIAPN